MIEPLKYFEREAPRARIMVVQPEVKRWVPLEYGGADLKRVYIRRWEDLKHFDPGTPAKDVFDYCLVYPKRSQ